MKKLLFKMSFVAAFMVVGVCVQAQSINNPAQTKSPVVKTETVITKVEVSSRMQSSKSTPTQELTLAQWEAKNNTTLDVYLSSLKSKLQSNPNNGKLNSIIEELEKKYK